MRPTLLGLTLVLSACGRPGEIPEDEFSVYGARALCARTAECLRGAYEATYYGRSDCEATLERDLEALVEFMADLDCSYDAQQAADAYNEVLDMSCEDFYEGDATTETNDIWGDCGLFTLPPTATYYQ